MDHRVCLCLCVERGESGGSDMTLWSCARDVGRCCFAFGRVESDADEGLISDPSGVCGIARSHDFIIARQHTDARY